MDTKKIRTYTELVKLSTYEDRLRYLQLDGSVGTDTFGFDRWMNQEFYKSPEWKKVRRDVIVRDLGRDLGLNGYDILGKIYVHHMNPISKDDLVNFTDYLLNPEYLICVSFDTHQAIHYKKESPYQADLIVRSPNDTSPWKK